MTPKKKCGWRFDEDHYAWDTECSEKHQFIQDGIKENLYRFCPYCGGKIFEVSAETNNS